MGLFTDTITLYNHKTDDTYQRTVIKGVQYRRKAEKTVISDGKINLADVVTVTIPDTAECSRQYVCKKDFRNVKDTASYWTLDAGGNLDIIIQGEINQEITEEYRLKHLKADYDCVTVASVADNRNRDRLKHIKVVCK